MKKVNVIFAFAGLCCISACSPTTPSPKTSPVETAPPAETQIMCTQDAQQCPDGSWVGRTGEKCEFICPNKK